MHCMPRRVCSLLKHSVQGRQLSMPAADHVPCACSVQSWADDPADSQPPLASAPNLTCTFTATSGMSLYILAICIPITCALAPCLSRKCSVPQLHACVCQPDGTTQLAFRLGFRWHADSVHAFSCLAGRAWFGRHQHMHLTQS